MNKTLKFCYTTLFIFGLYYVVRLLVTVINGGFEFGFITICLHLIIMSVITFIAFYYIYKLKKYDTLIIILSISFGINIFGFYGFFSALYVMLFHFIMSPSSGAIYDILSYFVIFVGFFDLLFYGLLIYLVVKNKNLFDKNTDTIIEGNID